MAQGKSERLYHQAPLTLADSSITLSSGPQPGGRFGALVRLSLKDLKERTGLSKGSYKLSLIPAGGGDTLSCALTWGNADFGGVADRRFTALSVTLGHKLLSHSEVEGFHGKSNSYSTLSVELSDGLLSVTGGSARSTELCQTLVPGGFTPAGATLTVTGRAEVSLFVVETAPDMKSVLATDWTPARLAEYLEKSTDSTEGFWRYLDRRNDPDMARPGGRYRLATVRNSDGGYDILYIDGAETLASEWSPCMLKGRLTPTEFVDHYSLEWTDAEFDTINRDIHADIADDVILTLSFPLLKTELRFSKERP